jgi:hypothetical protein
MACWMVDGAADVTMLRICGDVDVPLDLFVFRSDHRGAYMTKIMKSIGIAHHVSILHGMVPKFLLQFLDITARTVLIPQHVGKFGPGNEVCHFQRECLDLSFQPGQNLTFKCSKGIFHPTIGWAVSHSKHRFGFLYPFDVTGCSFMLAE